MKQIIAATDFSHAGNNAVDYACQLALAHNMKLELVFAQKPSLSYTGLPLDVTAEDQEQIHAELEALRDSCIRKYSQRLNISAELRYGFAVPEILSRASEISAELIVCGMGAGNHLSRKLFGTTSTSLIKESAIPVLTIGSNVRYQGLGKVLLAADGRVENLDLSPLTSLALADRSHIYIVNVVKRDGPVKELSDAAAGMSYGKHLGRAEHSFHVIEEQDIIEGINSFVRDHHITLVAMVPHSDSVLRRLLNESTVDKMAFHASVAVLSLPEKRSDKQNIKSSDQQ
jgi:nucleotide-binding universal stress UspA family protein